MKDKIKDLQDRQFGFLNHFHTERTGQILQDLHMEYGDAVIEAASRQPINKYSLYEWHTERYIGFLENLVAQLGPGVLEKIIAGQVAKEAEAGRGLATSCRGDFNALVDHFSGGQDENVIDANDDFVLIKTHECFAGRIAQKMGKSDLLYAHHCGLDAGFVQGFDPKYKLEIQKSIMRGDAYCLHKIWKKSENE